MTNEQAIKELQESHDIMRNHDIDESESYLMQALNMAIKALQEQADNIPVMYYPQVDGITPTVVAQADGEYISRKAVLSILADHFDNPFDMVRDLASVAIPPAGPKTGHWIYDDIANNWRCDKCGETPKTMGYVGTADFMSEHFKFCNHCGARMVEPQESEDKE